MPIDLRAVVAETREYLGAVGDADQQLTIESRVITVDPILVAAGITAAGDRWCCRETTVVDVGRTDVGIAAATIGKCFEPILLDADQQLVFMTKSLEAAV